MRTRVSLSGVIIRGSVILVESRIVELRLFGKAGEKDFYICGGGFRRRNGGACR
jgi:hypothetical protein